MFTHPKLTVRAISHNLRLSDKRMCREKEFQLLGEDTQNAREAKDDLTHKGTARR